MGRAKNIFNAIFGNDKAPVQTKRAEAALIINGNSTAVYSQSYNGEKNLGELGPLIDYIPSYYELRLRSWQAYTESDIAKTILKRYTLWIIDKGLSLKSNPSKVLKGLNSEAFNDEVEAHWLLWAKSKLSSYNGMMTLDETAKEAFKNATVGGDVLVVLRLVDGVVNVQLIDGGNVSTPLGGAYFDQNIIDGVHTDSTGKHIGYWVRTEFLKWEYVKAYSETTGFRTAFLVCGDRYKLDSRRGIPLIATTLETIKKIERYREAAVGSAEERQKITLFIQHHIAASGENPMIEQMARAYNVDGSNADLPKDIQGSNLANTVAATTNKSTYNMPPGAELKSVNSTQEMFFKEFYQTNADIVCATIGIPPNVAFAIYNDSFSASRAATKDWDHTIQVVRDEFQTQFYQIIYAFWLHIEILKGNIQAPGYLTAKTKGDNLLVGAYSMCRFTGPLFPHIDPVKEANAERLKLGPAGAHLPLTTLENATEVLNGVGDSDSNMEQFAVEIDYAKQLGIQPEQPQTIDGAIDKKINTPKEA